MSTSSEVQDSRLPNAIRFPEGTKTSDEVCDFISALSVSALGRIESHRGDEIVDEFARKNIELTEQTRTSKLETVDKKDIKTTTKVKKERKKLASALKSFEGNQSSDDESSKQKYVVIGGLKFKVEDEAKERARYQAQVERARRSLAKVKKNAGKEPLRPIVEESGCDDWEDDAFNFLDGISSK